MLRVYDRDKQRWELIDHDSAEDCYREALDILGIEFYWADEGENGK